MTCTSCAFILTKSLTYPCIILFFLRMYNYAVIDSLAEDRYRKASGYCGGFESGDVWGLIASLGGYS
jgi:hypothetical protein